MSRVTTSIGRLLTKNERGRVLDLRGSTGIDGPALIAAFQWMGSHDGAGVTVLPPNPKLPGEEGGDGLFKFLSHVGLLQALEAIGAKLEGERPVTSRQQGRGWAFAPFRSKEEVGHLASLLAPGRDLFEGVQEAALRSAASSSAIRLVEAVVSRELGDNVVDHGGSKGWLFAQLEPNAARVIDLPDSHPLKSELRETPALCVSVGDVGPTVLGTLSGQLESGATAADAIEYALRQFTSAKEGKRWQLYEQGLRHRGLTRGLTGTGLYYVDQAARVNRGSIDIESGGARIIKNYARESGGALSAKPSLFEKRSVGTRVTVCLPLWRENSRASVVVSRDVAGDTEAPKESPVALTDLESHYVCLSAELESIDSRPGLLDWLDRQTKYVDELRSRPSSTVLILDGVGVLRLSEEAQTAATMLAVLAAARQSDNFVLVAFEPPPRFMLIWQGGPQRETAALEATLVVPATITLDSRARLGLLGTDAETARVLHRLLLGFPLDADAAVAEHAYSAVRHILSRPPKLGSRLHLPWILRQVERFLADEIRTRCLRPRSGVVRQEGLYLLPAGRYAREYFVLERATDDDLLADHLAIWVGLAARDVAPTHLVTVGTPIKKVVRRAQEMGLISATVVSIDAAAYDLRVTRETGSIEIGARVALAFDVVATGESARTMSRMLPEREIRLVLAIVDGRSPALATDLNVRAPIRHPVALETRIPEGYSVEDVVRVDPISHVPIQAPYLLVEPVVWATELARGRSEFVRDCGHNEALGYGHYHGGGRHMTAAFNTPLMLSIYAERIISGIVADLDEHARVNRMGGHDIDSVAYPAHTPGAKDLATQLAEQVGAARVVELSDEDLSDPVAGKVGRLGQVLAVDDASGSGTTARGVIDFAEQNGALRVFMYILANRAPRAESRRLQQIVRYGRTSVVVRYLAEFPVPTFSALDCPVCRRRDRYRHLAQMGDGAPYRLFYHDLEMLERDLSVESLSETAPWFRSAPLELIKRRAEIEIARQVPAARAFLDRLFGRSATWGIPQRALLEVVTWEEEYFRKHSRSFADLLNPSERRRILSWLEAALRGEGASIVEEDRELIMSFIRAIEPLAFLDESIPFVRPETLGTSVARYEQQRIIADSWRDADDWH